jgi:N-acyl-phosphatidylethanolamine-hydrolysing phospholipase D
VSIEPMVLQSESDSSFIYPTPNSTNQRRFHNPPGSPRSTGSLRDLVGYIMRQAFRPMPTSWPTEHAVPAAIARGQLAECGEHAITWLGHAGFALTLGGRRIVIDPFLADRASPVSFAGPRRFIPAPLGIRDLGPIDTLVISHNHYDHLCWHTLKHLPNKATVQVICPTGLGRWFKKRGFQQITELGWHHSTHAGTTQVTAVPAIHHSRRGLFDSNRSLWAGYLFEHDGFKIYFGGDSAMGPVFRQTGHRYGPIDLALIGIGAYAPRKLLRSVHASPEEAVEMGLALKARQILGMHWGTIELSEEEAFEPARRFVRAARDAGYHDDAIWLPSVGETRPLPLAALSMESEEPLAKTGT